MLTTIAKSTKPDWYIKVCIHVFILIQWHQIRLKLCCYSMLFQPGWLSSNETPRMSFWCERDLKLSSSTITKNHKSATEVVYVTLSPVFIWHTACCFHLECCYRHLNIISDLHSVALCMKAACQSSLKACKHCPASGLTRGEDLFLKDTKLSLTCEYSNEMFI